MFGLLIALAIVGSVIWVGFDASKRDWSDVRGSGGTGTGTWVVGCILLWIIVFPMYLVKRGNAPFKTQTGSPIPPPSAQMYRECPHCKEAMRRDAQACPHCRQPSTPWQFHEGRWWYRSSEQAPWHWLDERTGSWVAATQV
jgi:hypothetical protein